MTHLPLRLAAAAEAELVEVADTERRRAALAFHLRLGTGTLDILVRGGIGLPIVDSLACLRRTGHAHSREFPIHIPVLNLHRMREPRRQRGSPIGQGETKAWGGAKPLPRAGPARHVAARSPAQREIRAVLGAIRAGRTCCGVAQRFPIATGVADSGD